VLNPYDLSRTPGGSSGGTAVGVALNFAIAGIGSDTMNSVRSPASACNLVGFRATRGFVSRAGVVPVSWSQDQLGPITKNVRDVRKIFEVIQGHYDSRDNITSVSTFCPLINLVCSGLSI
jgi:amidase